MTPQKSLKRAYEQRDPEVKTWLKEEYPNIKARARGISAVNKKQWKDKSVKPMKILQKNSSRIKSYFEHEKICYVV
jgi:hypothetical protein